ncbi:MAG: hypothetical protein KF860_03315 [Cyclobacteriaceae bacterium]|nr:hypothetical protein [Cyclobacteriaceae bacterium]
MKPVDITAIEIFKTNVNDPESASAIIKLLKITFPSYQFNFDLEDCDKILRVESETGKVNAKEVIALVKEKNVDIEIVE